MKNVRKAPPSNNGGPIFIIKDVAELSIRIGGLFPSNNDAGDPGFWTGGASFTGAVTLRALNPT